MSGRCAAGTTWSTARARSGEAVPVREDGRLDAIAHPQLRQYPGDVSLHRALTDTEAPRDLGIAQAGGDETENLRSPLGEGCERSAAVRRAGAGSLQMPHNVLPHAVIGLVDRGVPFSDALTTVTTAAAAACRVGERKGRIAVGYDADLLIARGAPRRTRRTC